MDWQSFIFQTESNWLTRLQKIADKRFQDDNNALEAFNFAFERMSKDDWAKLNKFRGDSKPDTFLIAVYNNLLKDFANFKFGKCRPPSWIARLGQSWSFIYRKLCCEKQQPNVISLSSALSHMTMEESNDIMRKIKTKIPSCGLVQSAVNIEDQQIADDASTVSPEDNYLQFKARWEKELIEQITSFYDPNNKEQLVALIKRIAATKQDIQLDVDGLLLLKLKYIEKLSMSKAAKMLDIPVKKAYLKLTETKKCLKEHLTELNLTFETV